MLREPHPEFGAVPRLRFDFEPATVLLRKGIRVSTSAFPQVLFSTECQSRTHSGQVEVLTERKTMELDFGAERQALSKPPVYAAA